MCAASLIVACSTWSGPGAGGGGSGGNGGNGDKDASMADMDAGDDSGPMGDAGDVPDPMGDAGPDPLGDAGGDSGMTPPGPVACAECAKDIPDTKGHEGARVVSCGDPDRDGIGEACNLEHQTCCSSQLGPHVATCDSKPSCGFSEVAITCDGPEDCHGGVCCFEPGQGAMDAGALNAQSVCAASCDQLGTGALRRCHVDADCDGATCIEDPASPFWGRCEVI